MLRQVAARLLNHAAERGAAAFATQADYSLAMKQAAELVKPPPSTGTDMGSLTGTPADIYTRPARIYVSTKSASQSGFGKTLHPSTSAPQWRISFETTAKWENPLIGWTSSADPLENVARASLFFFTKEQAIDFCKKHGWPFTVDEPNVRRTTRTKRFAGYGDNFSIKRKGLPDMSHLPSERN